MHLCLDKHPLRLEHLEGGLLACLGGLLPAIGTGAVYLVQNIAHGIDFATGGRMGEGRISAMVSILNINTLWLPLTAFLLLVPVVRKHKAAVFAVAALQTAGAAINFSRGLYTEAVLEVIIAAVAISFTKFNKLLSEDLGASNEC